MESRPLSDLKQPPQCPNDGRRRLEMVLEPSALFRAREERVSD